MSQTEISDEAIQKELDEQEAGAPKEASNGKPKAKAIKPKLKAKAKPAASETTLADPKVAAKEKKRIERELDAAHKEAAAESKAKAKGGPSMKAKKKTAATATTKSKTRGGKPKGSHSDYEMGKRLGDDDAFVTTMAKYIKKDKAASWSTVIKAMRADGHAAGQKRARRLFAQAQKAAGSKSR
jgi:outer membrane biosynthesis protein TonB